MGGGTSSSGSRSPIPYSRFPILFLFIFLRTLLHAEKAQLFCFQAIPHSLRKNTRGWGEGGILLTSHFSSQRTNCRCGIPASVSVNAALSANSALIPVLPFNFQLSTFNFLLFEYRIEVKPHDRPAPIGSLQIGDAANSRRFRLALLRSVESSHQTCRGTSRRAPR